MAKISLTPGKSYKIETADNQQIFFTFQGGGPDGLVVDIAGVRQWNFQIPPFLSIEEVDTNGNGLPFRLS
jgi:hypothetical protein